jgi:hypothetical protein
MKFIVLYVQGGSDKSESFNTKGEAETFIDNFLKNPDSDNWVTHVFYGMELEYRVKIREPKNV